ncbi:MAG: glycosyltransferase family 9 protein [Aquabacterium sp.]
MRRPLIVRLCNMVGDVVLGLPALQLLDAQGYDLQLYGKGWAKALLGGHGWPITARAGKLSERIAQLHALRQQCRQRDPGFDKRVNTLIMPNSFSSAFEARWAGLKPAGFARDGRSLLLSQAWHAQHPSPPAHALEGFWELACRLTGTDAPPPDHIGLQIADDAQRQADALMTAHGIAPGFTCIVPYAAGDVDGHDKRWPGFPEFTRELAARRDRQIVTCPGPDEEDTAHQDHPSAICLPGVKLDTYLGLLKRAALVISNDTGPAHMAAAVGTPVLSTLGPTKPEQWRPWSPQARIAQGPNRQWPSVADVIDKALA